MPRHSHAHWIRILALASVLPLPLGCFEDVQPNTTNNGPEGDGDPSSTSGDGDGDPGDGDGDGAPGDGDGDGTPGDGDGDGDGDPGDGDGDGGPSSCESEVGFICVPDPGPAWAGPVALQDLGIGCGDGYPDELESLFAGLANDPGACDCSCGQPNVSCSTSMQAIGYASNNCVNGQGSQAISQNQCYNTFSASHAVSLAGATSSCAAGNVTENLPPPTFASSVLACGGFEPGAGTCVAGALCVPEPGADAQGGLCYMSEGDVACPAGYPDKTLYGTEVQDTRACPNTCTCTATQAICQVTITGFAADNCVSPQGAVSTDSGSQVCAAASPVVQSIRPGNVSVKNAGTCNPANVPVMGEVSLGGSITVCCSG